MNRIVLYTVANNGWVVPKRKAYKKARFRKKWADIMIGMDFSRMGDEMGMSCEGLSKKQERHLMFGWTCPYCGTRYMDKKEQEDCKRDCRQRTREMSKRR